MPASVPLVQLGTLRAELDGATVRIGPPIDPAYDSGEGQDALERRYATRPGGLENAAFFESFYGRNASCNPLAIDRELARRAPQVTRYWSVVDLSVQVPEGAVAVVEGSSGVVARPWIGAPARRQRLAAATLRAAARDRSCCRPGTAPRSNASPCIGPASIRAGWPPSPASRGAGTCCSRRTPMPRASSARRTRSSRGRCGSRATRATTC